MVFYGNKSHGPRGRERVSSQKRWVGRAARANRMGARELFFLGLGGLPVKEVEWIEPIIDAAGFVLGWRKIYK